ncbi:hypothetical protein KAF25_000096 [Fusarium avenaceum]|uniref:Uncharacterized protein n=1 Tax=Fusarium avenaceum TaxID=40199 RepID=A0A9P7GUU2_9HYPO|nr:hypothetical protein KAF25_000096 [Fusarium avenaceum]
MRIPPYPRIEIFWLNYDFAVFDPTVEMAMLEAQGGYFETVRHAIVRYPHEQRVHGEAPLALAAPAPAAAAAPKYFKRDEESWVNKVNRGDKGDDRELRRTSISTSTSKQ